MSNSRLLVFDVQSLARLITHYTEGSVMPLDAEVISFGVHPRLQRMVQLVIRSHDWPAEDKVNPVTKELEPISFRYEGKRTVSWSGKGEAINPEWSAASEIEAPKRQ